MEKDNIHVKRIVTQEEASSVNNERPFYKKLSNILIIFIILVYFTSIIPTSSKGEPQMKKPCNELEGYSLKQQSPEDNIMDQLDCLSDPNDYLINLFILGIINIDELTMWVLGVDRRLVVLKMMHEKKMIQAADIADSTDRSLQNISYAMRELEEHGLIKCLTPGKHTWKKYIPTEKGTKVFEKLKKDHFIN